MRNQHSRIFIIIVLVLSIASIAFSHYRPEFTGPIRSVFSFFVVPIQNKINDIGLFFVEKVTNRYTLQQAEQRIIDLENQVASLSEANNMLKQQSYENDRLRKLYQLSDEYGQYKKVAARIIAKESQDWFQQFKIDKGSRDGIKVDMNVLSKNGLCGIVTYVGYNYSTVRAIIDDESVAYNITLSRMKSDKKRVQGVLSEVSLEERENDCAVVLSGGEKQRLGLARALYKNASIIYADEPTASLDSENREKVISLLHRCTNNGAVVILATHDLKLAEGIPRCGAARGAARLVRPKITVIIRPKCKHFVLYFNSYLGVLNNYKLISY